VSITRSKRLAAAGALALAGCLTMPARPACNADGDCPTDTRCAVARGVCEAAADATAATDTGPGDARAPDAAAANVLGGPEHAESYFLRGRPAVDFLFVIDDSGSMCEEQAALASALADLAGMLEPADRPSPLDYRVAVVTTDMRTETARGRFVSAAPSIIGPACDALAGPLPCLGQTEVDGRFTFGSILSPEGVRRAGGAPAEALSAQIGCLVRTGTSGDGFEKGLEAMRVALSCDGPNAPSFGECCHDGVYDPACAPETSPDFLRPDATLAVFVLSDEDDCSDPASNLPASHRAICRNGPHADAFDDAATCGGRSAAACRADECGELDLDTCYAERCVIERSDSDNCVWYRDRTLTPVTEYVDFLRGLKRAPDRQIVVVALTGPRLFLGDFEVSFNPGTPDTDCVTVDGLGRQFAVIDDTCCPRGQCIGHRTWACESPHGLAHSGRRYLDLASAFAGNGIGCPPDRAGEGTCLTICDDVYRLAVDQLKTKMAAVSPLYCLDATPACLGDDGHPCTAAEETEPARRAVETRLKCPDGATGCADASVVVEANTACPSGFAVSVTGQPPGGTLLAVRYHEEVHANRTVAVADGLPAPIPDDSPPGVSSVVSVDASGVVKRAVVDVDISHPTSGDLTVTLTHGEQSVLLFAGQGENENDLHLHVDVPALVGQPAAGPWTLDVADLWPLDVGTLRAFSVTVDE